ncbi:MAG TPA: dihydroorotate dehydrogenase-like protein [Bacteroidales bacterium]|nr:dihydroorotate dehydrogenase-like protein [Bacteroidales bacterium]
MDKLSTTYLGLSLKSPVIVSSSRLTSSIDNLRLAEENGAGAVVLKSLFEEQIMYHINEVPAVTGYPEADDYISSYTRAHTVDSYLSFLRDAKKTVSLPVIASVNCFTAGSWVDFAAKVEDAGADALEVNAFFLPLDRRMNSSESEKMYFELAEKLVKRLTIPVVMKISHRFSNILNIVNEFYARGVKGVVMFNRFYEPDIDINRIEVVPAAVFSSREEMRYVLRWVGMVSAQSLRINISASTGVKNGEDVIKYLLAGADTVQVCSVLYQNGMSFLKDINADIQKWMTVHNYDDIKEFRGMLNWKNTRKPVVFERTQFMKYFSSVD